MCVVLLYFSISKVAKKGTVQFVQWKFPKQHNKLEGLVILCGILWEYFIPTWKEPKAKKNPKHKICVLWALPKKVLCQKYANISKRAGGRWWQIYDFKMFLYLWL